MGNNQCKRLGIQPGVPIGTEQFDSIFARYASKASVAKEGVLSVKQASKLLNDLASAAQIRFAEDVASRIIAENSNDNKIPYENFKNLFKSLNAAEPRFQLTQSLQTQIGIDDEDPTPTSAPTRSETSKKSKKPKVNKYQLGAIESLPHGWDRVQHEGAQLRKFTVTTFPEIVIERFFEFTYGEDTSLPIDILEAHFFFNIIPYLNACVVDIDFIVTNSSVSKEIQAKLRLPLSTGAVISRFAFEAAPGTIVEGIVLPKKKAAAVEYLEKEKGRNVGTTKKVEGDLFETTVFPLPHLEKRKMSVSFLAQLEQQTKNGKTTWSYSIPFGFSKPVKVFSAGYSISPEDYTEVRVSAPFEQQDTTLASGFVLEGDLPAISQPFLAVGESDGLLHFAAYVPPDLVKQKFKTESSSLKKDIKVGVIWDRSVSVANSSSKSVEALQAIHQAHEQNDQNVSYTLFTYNTFATKVLDRSTFKDLTSVISQVFYDGGTDLTSIDEVLQGNNTFDYILLFTDGLDNIGHAKRIPQSVMDSTVPIHVITPATGNINADLLKSIAARTGGIFENSGKINGVLDNITGKSSSAIISQVEIKEVDGGSFEELFCDETFQTVPDWKLTSTSWEISNTRGAYVTGSMRFNLISKITIHLKKGSQHAEIPLSFNIGSGVQVLESGLGRLLALIHCQQAMTESRILHVDPAFSSHYLLELALGYRTVSEQTSLLFLLKAEQFLENEIDCPSNHPAFSEWKKLSEKAKKKSKKTPEQIGEEKILGSATNLYIGYLNGVLSKPKPQIEKESPSKMGASVDSLIPMLCERASASSLDSLMPCAAAPPPMLSAAAPARRESRRSAVSPSLLRSEAAPPPPPGGAPMPCAAAPPPPPSGAPMPCPAPLEDMLFIPHAAPPPHPTTLDDIDECCDVQSDLEKEADASLDAELEQIQAEVSSSKESVIISDPSQYLEAYTKLSSTDIDKAALDLYKQVKEANKQSPSFYFNTAREFLERGVDKKLCVQIITNALELNVQDIQMFRSTAYFMLQLDFISQAILLFEQVMELAPEEPQSFLDLGLAHFVNVRRKREKSTSKKEIDVEELRKAIDLVVEVLKRTWNSRFREIEYVALIWLNWMIGYGKHFGVAKEDLYPAVLDKSKCIIPDFKLALIVALGWDTDRVDIDLHVKEPSGVLVYYGNRDSPSGGHLSADITQGYGPEVYAIKHYVPGSYNIRVRYFASHQDSATTGATSAVVWRVIHLGDWEKEDVLFRCVRLAVNQSEHDVMEFILPKTD